MLCPQRITELESPLTQIFGVLFILISLFATCGNGLVLFIIWQPSQSTITLRTLSNKILTSLAVADILVGLIVAPISAWQVLNTDIFFNCNADYVRRYFTVSLVGSSVLTLGLISYDRYILLTKLNNYSKFMTRKKIIVMLLIAWVFPALIPLFQFEIFGPYIYLALVIFVTILSFVIVSVSYYFIIKAIREKEQLMKSHNDDEGPEVRITRSTKKVKMETLKSIKLGKAVALLIGCYAFCIAPFNIWVIINLFNIKYSFVNMFVHQLFYMITVIMVLLNSCCNPIIYYLKNPEFRKKIKNLLSKK